MSQLYVPRPYQGLIIDFIQQNERCAIWAGMGLGKSVSTLTALSELLLVEDGPVLVVAPLRVARTTWPDEVRKWSHLNHLRIMPVIGDLNQRRAALRYRADIYTTNFEQLPWLVDHFGEKWPYKIVIIDEATKLKGHRLKQGTQRAKALARVAWSKVSRLVELTGTPSPNGLLDLWGQAWFLETALVPALL
jgi:SNF2 family DNA or RNA helicase